MNSTPEQVARAINNPYSFHFSDYLNRGFQLVGKQPGLFLGYTVIYLLILLVCQIIPLAGTIGSLVAGPCLAVGFYLAASKAEKGELLEFGDFFKGFDFVGPLVLIAVLQMVLLVMTLIPFGAFLFLSIAPFSSFDDGGGGVGMLTVLLVVLFMVPVIYLAISWSLAPFLVVFHRMDAWPAMEASRKIVTSKWFSFFLFYIVVGFIMVAGAIALGIGLVYTIPAGMCMYYAAFKDVVGLPEDNQEPTFLDHLVD